MRLDHYLAQKHPNLSRGFLQKLIAEKQILVNDRVSQASYKLKESDKVKVIYDLKSIGKVPKIELPIIYEDEDILVVDKPVGVLSHALTKFHNEPSVASFLRDHLHMKGNEDLRFGIVHRLDRATSGVMICAKNHAALSSLQKQFSSRGVEKTYLAVVEGTPEPSEALLSLPLERNPKAPATFRVGPNGKSAETIYKVLKTKSNRSLIQLTPKTGRTHQIRIHLKHIGHPIIGDKIYGKTEAERLYLHATSIKIKLPSGELKMLESPIPNEFNKLLETV